MSGCLFFITIFFAIYLEIDSFWSKKVSVGLRERKIHFLKK